ncbi:MAG TPA: phosphatase PAP2 family protein [Rhizomicrobium sp.]|nr:phosphatase PAP2 family protein [Rhizomicrobium sp.]
MTAAKRLCNFPVEWGGLVLVALADLVWAHAIHFHLVTGTRDFLLIAIVLALMGVARGLKAERAALVMEYFCLSLVTTAAYGVFSYLAMASAYGPLRDGPFLAADRALGFDWPALYRWIMARPGLALTLQLLYASMLAQGLIAGVVLGMRGERHDMRVLFRIIFIASFICCIGAMLAPALGPYQVFHIQGRGAFLIDMKHLLSHRNLTFRLRELTGVISFPSFHAVVALAYAWGLRRAGLMGMAMLGINAGMFLSIPAFGGHYLVDVIAGSGVMLLSLVLTYLSFICLPPLPAHARERATTSPPPARFAHEGEPGLDQASGETVPAANGF